MVELPQQQPQQMMPGAPFALPTLAGQPMMLPSLSAGSSMLPSMDPSMTDDVAARYGQMLIQQNASQLQEMMVLSGDYSAAMRSSLAELNAVGSNLQSINQILSNAVTGLQQSGAALLSGSGGSGGSSSGGGGGGTRMAPTGLTEGGSGTPAPSDEPQDTRTFRQRLSEGRAVGQDPHTLGQRVSQVTRSMAGRASEAFQSKMGKWDLTPDANGNINYYDPDGNVTHTAPATEDNIARATQEGARADRTTGLLSRYADGESLLGGEGGLLGGFGAGALKAAGPIGLAIGVADMGFKQFASQTEAGTQYRAAYGQDAGRFAFSQRAGADEAGIGGYFSGIGFGRAKQNYEAAAQQGLQGDQLHQATGFMNDMYSKLGLDTQTSVQAVQIAAQNTNISLSTLSDNIMAVSKASVEAGKNSEVAIQSFLQVTTQLQQNVTNTAAAPQLAGTISTQLSKNLASSLNTPAIASSLAGALTQTNIAEYAQQAGISYTTAAQEVATGTGGAAAGTIDAAMERSVDQICTAGQTTPDGVRAVVKQLYGNATRLDATMQQNVMNHMPGFKVSPAQMVMIFGVNNVTVMPGDVVSLFFGQLLKPIGLSAASASGAPKDPSSAQVKGGASQILGQGGLSAAGFAALGQTTTPVGGSSGKGGGAALAAGVANATSLNFGPENEYSSYAQSSGNRDLAIEALISNAKKVQDYTGKGSLDDVKFQMPDGSGKSLSEIMKDPALLAQFDQGTPYVQSKNGKDVESVSTFTNYGASANAPGGGGGGGGAYTFQLSPAAERLFSLVGPTPSQSQGVPPSGSQPPTSYPK